MADGWMHGQVPISAHQPYAMDAASLQESSNFSALRTSRASVEASSSPPDQKTTSATPRIRRRNRTILSCLECRRRKLKCDKQAPCTNCVRFKRDCLYLAPASDPHSQQKLADLKEKMGLLERNLEREVVSQTVKPQPGSSKAKATSGQSPTQIDVYSDEDELDDDELLEPTPLTSIDNVYEDNADDELMDLGVQMGKMRISERIGGFIRPKLVNELNDTLEDIMGSRSQNSATSLPKDAQDLKPTPKIQASPKSYIGPGPDYIAPASSLFFPGTNMNTTLMTYLPRRLVADELVAQYWIAVHPIARAVHRPTFEAQYAVFWASISAGTEPMASMQAIVFAALLSAAVSMTNDQIVQHFGTTKAAMVDSLRSGTEFALTKANFLRTTRVDTMQAFVMYLIPLVRAEVSRAHSALVGTAIRLAECMGLHRDASHYGMSPVETHIRRLIWHQLCFLDMRTCEATGPRPAIRKDDYDTRLPLNVDDIDLTNSSTAPQRDKDCWTEMTMYRIRAECMELRRGLWFDILQLDKKKKSLTSVLVRVQKIRTDMENRYLPMLNDNIPVQLMAKKIMTIGVASCFVQVLHRYLFSTSQKMPDRLRQIVIEAGLTTMETAIQLETTPELNPWMWYKGALNQYHSALMLMVEVYAFPMRKEAPRIWKCLDFIFDIPPHLLPKQKAELVITDLRDRMEVYHQMRKIKTTTRMDHRVSALTETLRPQSASGGSSSDKTAFAAANDVKLTSMALHESAVNAPVISFGSPPGPGPDSITGTGSRHGSVPSGEDIAMQMDTIDWAEWDKHFPIEQNTGDLNIPDFNLSDFTAGWAATDALVGNPAPQDLSDVTFGPPALYPSGLSASYGHQPHRQN